MILWDRVKKSFDNGIEQVMRVSRVLSERARIETSVARLLIDKGSLETRLERLYKQLGEQTELLVAQEGGSVTDDPEVAGTLKGIREIKEEIELLRQRIRKISSGEEED